MLNMACCSSSSRRRRRKRNWLLLLFLLSWTTLSHSSSLPFIDSVKCSRARISSCQACLFLSLSLSLPLSHDVNYRFWMSSFSNYSGTDLLFFLSFPLYIYICMWLCVCAPARWQTWKYPCLLSTWKRDQE